MGLENVTLFAAFLAGLLSFISPCVLPLIPVYLGYLSGSTITGDEPPSRKLVFTHALLFVGGFTLIFVTFGAFAGLLGSVLFTITDYIVWIGGILLIVFGLHVMGVITIPIFNQQKRMEYGQGTKLFTKWSYRDDVCRRLDPLYRTDSGRHFDPGYYQSKCWSGCLLPLCLLDGAGYTLPGNGLAADSGYQSSEEA